MGVPMKMAAIKSPDPQSYVIIAPQYKGPIVSDIGASDHHCSNCDALLIEGSDADWIRSVIIKCDECGSYSIVTGD